MPCYHPLTRWKHKFKKTKNGKNLIAVQNWPPDAKNLSNMRRNSIEWNRVEIPCGQCIGCRMQKSEEMRVRCILEAKSWEHNYFVTLTYDDAKTDIKKHWKPAKDTETGENILMSSLYKPDLQKFIKDLRRYYKYHYNWDKIRFYRCGEYGEQNERGHYHAILFNLPIKDLKPLFINMEHQQIYTSETIEKIWGHGICTVGEVTYQSRRYVRRYIMKKQTGKQENKIRTPEFTECSRRPGIAAKWYNEHKRQTYEDDELIVKRRLNKAVATKPPKYFDRLYEVENPAHMERIKNKRLEAAIENRNRKLLNTSLTPDELLKTQEDNYIKKITTLKRGMKEI